MRKKLPKINKQDNEELENMKTTEQDSIHVDLGVRRRFRNWIKRKFGLYDISDLQIGEHCGLCGVWIPNEISPKEWAFGICKKCIAA